MRTFIKIPGLLFAAIGLAFVSCSEEEVSSKREITTANGYTYSLPFSAPVAGEEVVLTADLDLSAIISEEAINNLIKEKSLPSFPTAVKGGGCYIRIAGLPSTSSSNWVLASKLRDFKIKIGGNDNVLVGNYAKLEPDTIKKYYPIDSLFIAAEKSMSMDTVPSLYSQHVTFNHLLRPVFDAQVASENHSVPVTISFKPSVAVPATNNAAVNITIGGTYTYLVDKK
jgi:hypothetical protein